MKQPQDRWVRIDVPDLALVGAETSQAAKDRIDENKQLAARNTRHVYLLRGRLQGLVLFPRGTWRRCQAVTI